MWALGSKLQNSSKLYVFVVYGPQYAAFNFQWTLMPFEARENGKSSPPKNKSAAPRQVIGWLTPFPLPPPKKVMVKVKN